MPFIGNQPALAYTSFAKQDFTTSATTNYVLDQAVTNANEIALFINFVRQEPTTAYTASGTALTLTSATTAGDDMYCIFLGKALQTVNPPAGSVGASQITDGTIGLAKLSATGTKDATTFLRGDNTFNTPPLGGITEADSWRLTSDTTLSGTAIFFSGNLERVDSAGFQLLGTGMSESSGIFTFPSTGFYLITAGMSGYNPASTSQYVSIAITTTEDNSTYSNASWSYSSIGQSSYYYSAYTSFIFDVTNISTHKVKFRGQAQHGSTVCFGATNTTYSGFQFIRLGDT